MEMRAPVWAWTGRLKPRTLDWLIVVVLTVLGLISLGVDPFSERRIAAPFLFPLAVGLLLVQTVPLAWRRTHPSLVLVLIASAFGLKILFGINPSLPPFARLSGWTSLPSSPPARRASSFWALAGSASTAASRPFA